MEFLINFENNKELKIFSFSHHRYKILNFVSIISTKNIKVISLSASPW